MAIRSRYLSLDLFPVVNVPFWGPHSVCTCVCVCVCDSPSLKGETEGGVWGVEERRETQCGLYHLHAADSSETPPHKPRAATEGQNSKKKNMKYHYWQSSASVKMSSAQSSKRVPERNATRSREKSAELPLARCTKRDNLT